MDLQQTLIRAACVGILVCGCIFAQEPSAIRWWGEFKGSTEGRDGRFLQVAAGDYVTAVLRQDGRPFVNGENNINASCEVPPAPAGLHYVRVSMRSFGMGLLSDGTIVVWGTLASTPPPAPPLPPGMAYTQISAGGVQALALRSDGVAVGWANPAWDLDGTATIPPALQGTVVKLSAGATFSLALQSSGVVVAWGANSYGECNVPPLPSGMTYVDIAAGFRHAVALRSDGMVVAWGENANGQCNVPALPSGTRYLLAAAGWSHSQAYRSDGVLVPWGDSSLGQANVPTLPPHSRCIQLACGFHHAVALLSNGQVLAWGENGFRQAYVPTLPQVPRSSQYVGCAGGLWHVLGLHSDGAVVAWGADQDGQTTLPPSLFGMHFTKVGAGWAHSVGLRDNGDLIAWGSSVDGRTTVPLLPPGVTYVDFSVGESHTVAVRSDGSAVAFGYTPVGSGVIPSLPMGLKYEAVDAAYSKTLLLRSDGALVYAGAPNGGQSIMPTPPPGRRFVGVAASRDFNAALLSDGSVVWWGTLSLSHPQWHSIPALPFGVYYVDVTCGYSHLVLRRSDGQVVVCGLATKHEDEVPPLDPGTSYVEIDGTPGRSTVARVGPTCTYVSFAHGCAGSLPATRLVPRDTPRIGRTLEVTLFDLPQDIAVLAFGWQQAPAPGVDLAFLGMPGCNLNVSLDAIVALAGVNQQAKWQLPIPNSPLWIGTRFYNQALVLDPGAGNGFGAVLSDAAEAVIGSR